MANRSSAAAPAARPDRAAPHEPTPGSVGLARLLAVALGLATLLALAWVISLLLPATGTGANRTLLVGSVALGILQLGLLYRCLDLARRTAGAGAAPPGPSPARAATAEIGQELQALLGSARTDEVGALMREFTRILNALQEQASEVQEYAARFETMNEELRNANLRLREMSLTDELTEVGNRRNFDMRMREEINRSTRFGHAFSLLLLDIDAFKKFNDEFGHPQGDAALRALGSLMRSMSREGDVPCRIGGEEFAFILPETAKADAMTFAERIRRGVESSIKAPDGAWPLTVSIGLAAFPNDGKSPEDILKAADEALYDSKRAGRNRVTAYRRKE